MNGETSQDTEHLKLLSIFHYVVGGLMALVACFPIIHLIIGTTMVLGGFGHGRSGEASPAAVGWVFIVIALVIIGLGWTLALCTVIAGRSLAQRRRYMFCLIVAGIMAVTCMPFGTVLGVFTIIVLLRPSVKAAFGAA
jgi:hypothetical protein